MSVRIDPTQVAGAVARRPFAYVITTSSSGSSSGSSSNGPHVRAVVTRWSGESFVVRVGSQTANNVERTGTVTVVWPPLATDECRDDYDDHTVIADCSATCADDGDSYELSAEPTAAVWHRPPK